MTEFIVPDFIKDADVATIHQRMRNNLPNTYDVSEGSHPWNLTYPNAFEYAYQAQHVLLYALMLIWPQFSWGTYLDYHAECAGLEPRKSGKYATGYIQITGTAGTEIPEGTIFATEATEGIENVSFETTAAAVISDYGTVEIPIVAIEIGTVGNVAAGTIVINSDHISGIETVINADATSEGVDEESDEALAERLDEYIKAKSYSYVGNKADYIRWAKEVTGVTEAVVIDPMENPDVDNDSGIITIVITDENGAGAGKSVCAAVYNHIMDPTPLSADGTAPVNMTTGTARLAPPNAIIVVTSPASNALSIRANVTLDGTQTLNDVKTLLAAMVAEYLIEAVSDGVIKYSRIGRCLSETDGISDYSALYIKDADSSFAQSNIAISATEVPVISTANITLTEV